MIDLNDASAPPPRFDLEAIVARLRETAAIWVPRHFPNGRREGDEWRLADISGRAPRKNGSCVIALKDAHAGDWYDHDGQKGGDPLSALGEATGLKGAPLFAYAADVAGLAQSTPRPAGKPKRQSPEDTAREITIILSHARPLVGTHAEAYLAARGITAPASPDLLFHPDLAHWEVKRGFPGMVAIVRDAAGQQLALHRTYLDPQKPAKAEISPARKTLGSVGGGAVRLAEPRDGLIGLAEGIETALAVMTACPDLPAWATLSAQGMESIVLPPDITRVVLLVDHDDAGRRAAQATAAKLAMDGRQVFLALPPRQGDDFNDLLLREGANAARALVMAATEAKTAPQDRSQAWKTGLLRSRDGKILPILANAIHALRSAGEWEEVLWHDDFATRTVARRPLPWAPLASQATDQNWSDRDDYLVTEWLQRHGIMVPASVAGQAVETVASDRPFHPVREYLDGLTWDGISRLDTWLIHYLDAADTPYTRAIGPRWLISAVARIYRPGCKADCVLILEGPQGIRKSSALKVLAEPWFTDRLSDLGSKDAAMETRGVWIIEVAELDTMTRAEVSSIKAFMSRTHDRFRPPYGKRLVDLPRQCVFAGSINPEGGYLKDATGGRRFWPIACRAIKLEALSQNRNQLWGEARERFLLGEPWWLETPLLDRLAAEQQADRYQADAWEEVIGEWLDHDFQWTDNGFHERVKHTFPRNQPLSDVSVREVLEQALGLERGRWTQGDQNRVVRCLTSMGFKLYWSRRGSRREKRYRRPEASDSTVVDFPARGRTTSATD